MMQNFDQGHLAEFRKISFRANFAKDLQSFDCDRLCKIQPNFEPSLILSNFDRGRLSQSRSNFNHDRLSPILPNFDQVDRIQSKFGQANLA